MFGKVKSAVQVNLFYGHVIKPKDQLQVSILQLLSVGLVIKPDQEPAVQNKSDYKKLIFSSECITEL